MEEIAALTQSPILNLAGTNCMAQHVFYFASGIAAACWVIGFGLAAYLFGGAFTNLASPAAALLGVAAIAIMFGVPTLIVRYEKRLLIKADVDRATAHTLTS